MTAPDLSQTGPWQKLFKPALTLMTHLESQTENPQWTFGGGTVLMLRLRHRFSRDIDLFVPDPQYLGYINPRLSDVAEQVSQDYEENAEFVKFFLPEGEIDIVVGASLTAKPYDLASYVGRNIRVETCAEIIAKKMWHRGHHAKARDLYDLCAVADLEPRAVATAAPFFGRHGAAFLDRLQQRSTLMEAEFKAINSIGQKREFAPCLTQARSIIEPLL